MSCLPDSHIRRYGSELIDPFNLVRVQPASYDLSLGDEFIVHENHNTKCIDLAQPVDDDVRRITMVDSGVGFVLHPKKFILGVTAERVSLPNNIMARLEGKSTIGRLGLMIHITAGFIDPGFNGPITLEIYNVRDVPIILRPGLPFCQISFNYMADPVEKPYNGRYQNAKGVEPSKPAPQYGIGQFKSDVISPIIIGDDWMKGLTGRGEN
jgi:dCTP deaminase